jgi:hypothetical protein
MPTITAISPTAKVRFPSQSILAGRRSLRSWSLKYAHPVPKSPNGTDTRNTSRQFTGASSPPMISPMNEPAIAATPLMPSARPRWFSGNASVRIALEFANSIAPPTPCPTRIPISHRAPALPFIGVTASRIENAVNTANPRL